MKVYPGRVDLEPGESMEDALWFMQHIEQARDRWAVDPSRCAVDGCLAEGTEPEREGYVCPRHAHRDVPSIRLRDLLPDAVTLVPRDADCANHPSFEEIPE